MTGKKIKEKIGSRKNLKNNEIKGCMKVIKSLQNTGISLEVTTRKTSQDFSIFWSP